MRGIRLAILAVALAFGTGAASAESYAAGSLDRYFRLEWDAAPGAKGPVISGYIYNLYSYRTDRMRLLIERLDSSGQVVGTSTTWVFGGVPANSRGYFSAPVEQAASYRVQVLSFDWIGRAGA